MEYNFYSSLMGENEKIKYENTLKVVKLMTKKGHIKYDLLKEEVLKIGGNESDLEDILHKYYVVKTINNVMTVFTMPVAKHTTKSKKKQIARGNDKKTLKDTKITPMSKEKEKQIKHANEIIYGKSTQQQVKTKKQTKNKTKKQVKTDSIAKYGKPSKKQQQQIDAMLKQYDRQQEKQKQQERQYNHVCYRFLTFSGEIIYVGRAKNLINRLESHAKNGHLSVLCYNKVDKVEFCTFESEDDLDIAERYYISKFQPEYNVDFKNKKYFTINELDNIQWKEYSAGAIILKNR